MTTKTQTIFEAVKKLMQNGTGKVESIHKLGLHVQNVKFTAEQNAENKDLSATFGNTVLCAVISWSEITQKLNKVKGRYFVYLLINDDEVIYVGRSFNLSCRLSWHKYRKNFDKVYLAEYETYSECCQAEKQITKYCSPVENKLWVNYGT